MRLRRDDTDTDEESCSGEVDVTQHAHQLRPTECTPRKQPHVTFEQDEVKDRREHPEMRFRSHKRRLKGKSQKFRIQSMTCISDEQSSVLASVNVIISIVMATAAQMLNDADSPASD